MTRRDFLALPLLAQARLENRPARRAQRAYPTFADFFDRADGPLGNNWTSDAWSVSSNGAVNAAQLGPEVLSDSGLEATYVNGLCGTLTKDGSPAVSGSADAHEGSKAQEFTGAAIADAARWAPVGGVPGSWWQTSVWAKRKAGTSGTSSFTVYSVGAAPAEILTRRIESVEYRKQTIVHRTPGSALQFIYAAREMGTSNFDTVVTDDGSLRQISLPSLFATRPANTPDVSVQANLTAVDGVVGLAARIDSTSDPQNFLVCYLYKTSVYWMLVVEKCVGGTYSRVGSSIFLNTGNLPAITGCLELRCIGPTVEVYWDAALQLQETVSENAITGNKLHGMFCCGSSRIESFGLANPQSTYPVLYAGTSITVLGPPTHSTTYQALSRSWLHARYPDIRMRFANQAQSGRNSWNNLVRWPAEGLPFAPRLVILDFANDSELDHSKRAAEAFIRRIRSAFPQCRIIALKFFTVADQNLNDPRPTPRSQGGIDAWSALAAHYGIPVVDYQAATADLVLNQRHNLNEYFADTIHPTDKGHALASSLLTPYLTSSFLLDRNPMPDLPQRLFDNGDYEQPPTVKLGREYDSRSGTWTDPSGVPATTEPGATITYSATCCSFGIESTSADYKFEVSIDGVVSPGILLTANGVNLGNRAARKISFKYLSGSGFALSRFYAI